MERIGSSVAGTTVAFADETVAMPKGGISNITVDGSRVGSTGVYNSNREMKAQHKIMQDGVRIWKCNANRIRRVKL